MFLIKANCNCTRLQYAAHQQQIKRSWHMCNVQSNFEQRCSFVNILMYNSGLLLWIPSLLILFYFYGYYGKVIVTWKVLLQWFICSKRVENLQKENLFSLTAIVGCDQERFSQIPMCIYWCSRWLEGFLFLFFVLRISI